MIPPVSGSFDPKSKAYDKKDIFHALFGVFINETACERSIVNGFTGMMDLTTFTLEHNSIWSMDDLKRTGDMMNVRIYSLFLLKYLEDISPFCGSLIPLFWTSGDVCPGFQSQCGSSHFHASSPAHNGILRLPSAATPADLFVDSMAAETFSSTYLWTSIGGAWDWDLSFVLLPHNVRPDRCSTNWTMLC